ncbi:UDP-N-acetylmuramoyl-L-alanyl-D-glutamate--2,6-diaminopimelate ligase [Nocardioides sp.]|uniref:UDP-N-acetylmuramoyl-L-alanyl-D-glutamate--2, 6-diaminopimelate ligase n=1 Tax=Nocardioides sp. TaxID=35761 RepID=UPI0035161E02
MASTPATRPARPPHTPLARVAEVAGAVRAPEAPEVAVTGLTLDSRRVQPGDLYAALPGARAHGADFSLQAAAAGAVAVLTDAEGAERSAVREAGLPVVLVDDARAVLGRVAALVYDHPAEALRTIGVTGTQGKTTVTRLLEAALLASGVRSAVVGTVGTRIAGQDLATSLTTPEAPDLHGLFARMRELEVQACALEISSHALVLGRVDGVVVDVAVFTNLGRDHLDFHVDMEDYYAAKASLFTPERSRRAVVCVDDEHGRRLAGEVAATSVPVRTYGVSERAAGADYRAVDVESGPTGSRFTVLGPDGLRLQSAVALPGAFNVANALAVVAAAAEAGLDPAAVAAALPGVGGVPGRLERVVAPSATDRPQPTVVVDYAHKPDAVEAVLRTLRPLTRGRLVVVIGAGGDRDRGKRPLMGRLAAALADEVVVTDDNPRSEDPASIRAEVLAGAADGPAVVREEGDRERAITGAILGAAPDDVVLVAGKGHETGQEVAGTVHPFDDREVARAALAARASQEDPR